MGEIKPILHQEFCSRIRFANSVCLPSSIHLPALLLQIRHETLPRTSCIRVWLHRIVAKCGKEAPMIAARRVWGIIKGHVPRKQWVRSEDIYAIVELHGKLDDEDREPRSLRSSTPRWKTLVRNVLANRVKKGRIKSRKRHIEPNG